MCPGGTGMIDSLHRVNLHYFLELCNKCWRKIKFRQVLVRCVSAYLSLVKLIFVFVLSFVLF